MLGVQSFKFPVKVGVEESIVNAKEFKEEFKILLRNYLNMYIFLQS
jgi:hypothetical protein